MKGIDKRFVLLASLLCGPAYAGDTPLAHGSIIRDFARITFEWPEPVYFTAVAHGSSVSLTFDHKANPEFSAVLSQLHPYVIGAERKPDGKTIMLTFDRPYRIRTFVSDTINGIDLLDIDPNQHVITKAKTKKMLPMKTAAIATAEPQQLAQLSPAAGHKKSAIPATPVLSPTPATNAAPVTGVTETKPAPNAKIKVSVSAAEDSAILRFPYRTRTAAAVFLRGHTLWVVFNQLQPLDVSDFDSLPSTVVKKARVITTSAATILRVPVSDTSFISVAKEDSSFDWAILVTPVPRSLANPIAVSVHTDPPAPANVFVPTLEMADPVTVTDPDIGDDLIITPLYKPGEGVAAGHNFVEFSLLATAQGVAVRKNADEVTEVPLRNGMRISLPQGATLTPGLPEAENKPVSDQSATTTLFPYAIWKSEEPEKFRDQLKELFRTIVASDTVQQASNARLRMAQLYLSEGMTVEALAALDQINRTNPSYYRSMKLAAMHGAANFLMYRFSEAARDFSASELNSNKEMSYWRAMLAELQGSPDQHYDYLALNDDYISKYPPLFRQRLAIVNADREVDAKAYNRAIKIFDTLEESKLTAPIEPYIEFLIAKIDSESGRVDEAQALWSKLAGDYNHPFVRARAEYSLIAWGLEHGTLNNDQAINRLERLRLSWSGDNLELNSAKLLGDLYAQKKDYADAMRVWFDIVKSFPNTAESIEVAGKMQATFVTLFNEGGADTLPPLDALSMFYQYRNFTPGGDVGNHIIEHLADRLIALDLLEQAATLVDHQMRGESEKEERSRLGTKLAGIYLANRQPKKGLEALAESVYGDNNLPLRLLRNQLVAQNIDDVGKPEDAILVLGKDKSPDAEHIRQEIYWKKKDWPHVVESVEALLKTRKDITAPVTLSESESLLKLALAYNFQHDATQLQYLRDYYGPLMAKSPNQPIFSYLTSKPITPNPENFDEIIKEVDNTRNFIDSYKTQMQTAALDKPVQP